MSRRPLLLRVMDSESSDVWHVLIFAVAVVALVVALVALSRSSAPVVYTSGPCAFLGIAALRDDPDTPVLVADCDGTQLGIPVVLP